VPVLTSARCGFAAPALALLAALSAASGCTKEASTQPAIKVDLDAFYSEGRANEAAVKDKYGSRKVEVQGVVGGIGVSFGRAEVTVVTKGGSLTARMTDSGSGAAALAKDQAVTVVCQDLTYAGTQGSRGEECVVASAGAITPGMAEDMNRARANKDVNEVVGNVLKDAAKNLADDLQSAASAAASSPHTDAPAMASPEPAPPSAPAAVSPSSVDAPTSAASGT
jgi:hypothetical protein